MKQCFADKFSWAQGPLIQAEAPINRSGTAWGRAIIFANAPAAPCAPPMLFWKVFNHSERICLGGHEEQVKMSPLCYWEMRVLFQWAEVPSWEVLFQSISRWNILHYRFWFYSLICLHQTKRAVLYCLKGAKVLQRNSTSFIYENAFKRCIYQFIAR